MPNSYITIITATLTLAVAWVLFNLAGAELAAVARLLVRTGGTVLLLGLLLGLLNLALTGLLNLVTRGLLLLEQVKQARHKTAEVALQQRKTLAETRKLEREAELTVVTAPLDHQVHIADLNPASVWQARHLEARLDRPGLSAARPPQPWEMALWLAAHHHRSVAPDQAGETLREAAPAGLLSPEDNLPERVDLADLLPGMQGTLKNIVLGVRLDSQGRLRTVSAPMYRLCHIGAAGATDSGKSNFGRAVAYQVFTAQEPVQVVLSDLKGTTFKAFAGARRLLYPIIHTPAEFIAVMVELSVEMNRRKALFKLYPTVETLMDYNKTGAEPLPYLVIFVDEVTNLFMSRETQLITLEMLREARAFGIYFVAMGQSWSHREMATSIRQQFRTGLHFGTNDPASSRMIVNSSAAVRLMAPGRALVSLPFGMSPGPVELQTPYIDAATVLHAFSRLDPAAAAHPMPVNGVAHDKSLEPFPGPARAGHPSELHPASQLTQTAADLQPTPRQARILNLWDSGLTDKKAISQQVYGQVGGMQYRLIEETLSRFGRL
jgi:hypothetical protein